MRVPLAKFLEARQCATVLAAMALSVLMPEQTAFEEVETKQMSSSPSEQPDEPGPCGLSRRTSLPLQQFTTRLIRVDECDVGLGVFANDDIAPGEVILALAGPLIDFAETKRRGPRECMAIQIGYDAYLDTQAPGVFVNHSCDPNSGIKEDKFLVALRPIRKGEEIRFDYSTTMEERSFTMNCLCGAPQCRGIIKDFSTLPHPVREAYVGQGIVMSFIVETTSRSELAVANVGSSLLRGR